MDNIEYYNNCYIEKYLCDICDSDFTKMSKFLSHSIHKHGIPEDEISYDCANCYQSFTILSNFQQHIVEKNLKTSEIKSENAEIIFINEKSKISDDSDIELDMKVFEQEAENNDGECQNYKCDLCEKNFFNSSFLLKSHLSKVHKGVESKIEMPDIFTIEKPKERKEFNKDSPSKVFKSEDLRIQTDGIHKRQCYHCSKSFTRTSHFKRHIRTIHEGQKDYKCESCAKSFSQAGTLKTHIRTIHKGHKDYKCESCAKSFSKSN